MAWTTKVIGTYSKEAATSGPSAKHECLHRHISDVEHSPQFVAFAPAASEHHNTVVTSGMDGSSFSGCDIYCLGTVGERPSSVPERRDRRR